MRDRKGAPAKRAVGTRAHIVEYLAEVRELFDPAGMASTRLAAAVCYPGSSVAFAQLLSGMERSGLIEREVRGKRTYRIRLGQVPPAGKARRAVSSGEATGSGGPGAGRAGAGRAGAGRAGAGRAGAGRAGAGRAAGRYGPGGGAGLDYDELARRLLVQVVRRLAEAEQPGAAAMETISGLEHELASALTRQGELEEENGRLREQLRAAERSLALARESLRTLPVSAGLDSAEVGLLQRLLAPVSDPAGLEQARPVRA